MDRGVELTEALRDVRFWEEVIEDFGYSKMENLDNRHRLYCAYMKLAKLLGIPISKNGKRKNMRLLNVDIEVFLNEGRYENI
jgi:hypothetical protein